MLGKKLLTLACAIGILASGACFAPIHYKPTPPPPLVAEQVKSVRVEVRNQSSSHRLDPAALAEAIVINLKESSSYAGISAHIYEHPEAEEDATLQATILSETAYPRLALPEDDLKPWIIEFKAAMTVTRRDGQSLWKGKAFIVDTRLVFTARDEESLWKDPIAVNRLLIALSRDLVNQAISQPLAETAPAEGSTSTGHQPQTSEPQQ